jgi:hypothetical protein
LRRVENRACLLNTMIDHHPHHHHQQQQQQQQHTFCNDKISAMQSSSNVFLPSRLTRRGRPRKVFRYLQGLEGTMPESKTDQHRIEQPQRRKNSDDSSHGLQRSIVKSERSGENKRKKVAAACLFCRRSHMTCDEQRPCKRCCHRGIEHLCTNEAEVVLVQPVKRTIKKKKKEKGKKEAKERGVEDEIIKKLEENQNEEQQENFAFSFLSDEGGGDSKRFIGHHHHQSHSSSQTSDFSTMLSYLPDSEGHNTKAMDSLTADELTIGSADVNTFNLTPWTSYIQSANPNPNPSGENNRVVDAQTCTSSPLVVTPTSTPAIALPQLMLQTSPRPTSSSSGASISNAPSPLEELQRLLATIGSTPSPREQQDSTSPLLTPSEYAALRNSSSPHNTAPYAFSSYSTAVPYNTPVMSSTSGFHHVYNGS